VIENPSAENLGRRSVRVGFDGRCWGGGWIEWVGWLGGGYGGKVCSRVVGKGGRGVMSGEGRYGSVGVRSGEVR